MVLQFVFVFLIKALLSKVAVGIEKKERRKVTMATLKKNVEDLAKTDKATILIKMGFFAKCVVKINNFLSFEFIMNLMIAV